MSKTFGNPEQVESIAGLRQYESFQLSEAKINLLEEKRT